MKSKGEIIMISRQVLNPIKTRIESFSQKSSNALNLLNYQMSNKHYRKLAE